MSLSLQLLQEQPEAVEAGLTHPEQRIGAAHLAEVWSPVAAAGVEDVGLAEHILDHEVLALQREARGRGGGMKNHDDCFVTSASVGKAEHAEEETKKGKKREQQGSRPVAQSTRVTAASVCHLFPTVCSSKAAYYPGFQLFVFHAGLQLSRPHQ